MTELYKVPKLNVEAEVSFPRTPSVNVSLFLSEKARSHTGFERLSDLLNGEEQFIPATMPDGRFVALNLNEVLTVQVDASYEFAEQDGHGEALHVPEAIQVEMEIILSDRSTRSGVLSYLLPPGHRRVQDALNQPERFLILRDEDRACFVGRRHIMQAYPKD